MGRGKGYHWQNPFEEIASIRASREERRRVMVVWSAATIRRRQTRRARDDSIFSSSPLVGRQTTRWGEGDGGTKSGELPSRSLSAHWRITNERAFKEIFCTFLLRRRREEGVQKCGVRWAEETSVGMIAARGGRGGGGKRVS